MTDIVGSTIGLWKDGQYSSVVKQTNIVCHLLSPCQHLSASVQPHKYLWCNILITHKFYMGRFKCRGHHQQITQAYALVWIKDWFLSNNRLCYKINDLLCILLLLAMFYMNVLTACRFEAAQFIALHQSLDKLP